MRGQGESKWAAQQCHSRDDDRASSGNENSINHVMECTASFAMLRRAPPPPPPTLKASLKDLTSSFA